MTPVFEISQLKVGLLIQEHDVMVEIIESTKAGIKVKGVSNVNYGNVNNTLIPIEDLKDVITDEKHQMFIIGLAKDYPEYYL